MKYDDCWNEGKCSPTADDEREPEDAEERSIRRGEAEEQERAGRPQETWEGVYCEQCSTFVPKRNAHVQHGCFFCSTRCADWWFYQDEPDVDF